jgi:uncharacterized membrane protein
MATPASIKGHPLHVILVPIPIGLWVFALVADVVAAVTGSAEWRTVAFYAIAGGVVGALLAAVPGFIDLFSMSNPKVKKIGLTHMALNLAAVLFFLLNFVLRLSSEGHAGPMALTVLGNVLIGFSGWLGGEMVYRHGVGVDTTPQPAAPAAATATPRA